VSNREPLVSDREPLVSDREPLVSDRTGRKDARGSGGRPFVLTAGTVLVTIAAIPFLAVAVTAAVGPKRWRGVLAEDLPGPVAEALGHRASAASLGIVALTLIWMALLVEPGRRWARSMVVVLISVLDVTLVMVLLAGTPHAQRLLAGAGVVVASLVGVVLSYQPSVERYLRTA